MSAAKVKTTTTVNRQYRISMDAFREFLGVPKNFQVIDINVGEDNGSQHTNVFIDTTRCSTQELADRQLTRKEEDNEITMEDDVQPERRPKRKL